MIREATFSGQQAEDFFAKLKGNYREAAYNVQRAAYASTGLGEDYSRAKGLARQAKELLTTFAVHAGQMSEAERFIAATYQID